MQPQAQAQLLSDQLHEIAHKQVGGVLHTADPTTSASIQTLLQLVQGLSLRQSQQDDRISEIVASLSQIKHRASAKLAPQHVASTPEPQPSPATPNITQPVAATLESQPGAAIPKTLQTHSQPTQETIQEQVQQLMPSPLTTVEQPVFARQDASVPNFPAIESVYIDAPVPEGSEIVIKQEISEPATAEVPETKMSVSLMQTSHMGSLCT